MLGILAILVNKCYKLMWGLVNSTDKVFNDRIRDLGFNPRLHQKPISVLV